MRVSSLLFAFTLLLSVPFSALFASEQTALDQLVELLDRSSDMQGEFVQLVVDGRGTRVQETRGKFRALKPDYFYWETREPLPQVIYVYKGEVTVFDPDLEQASVQPLGDDFGATPALLFNGDRQAIAQQFLVEKRTSEGSDQQFLLFPIEEGSLFEVLRVRFSGSMLSDLRISDSLGQDTTISFIHTEINSGLKSADFVPNLPSGIDIIRQDIQE